MVRFLRESEFKKTEVGEIPKDWKIGILRDVVKSLESGNRPKGGKLQHDPNGVLSIGGENITWEGELILNDCLRFNEDFYKTLKKGKIECDDILLVKDGATIGKLAYIKEIPEGKAMVNEHVFLIKTDERKYNPKFLFYYLFSESGQATELRYIFKVSPPVVSINAIPVEGVAIVSSSITIESAPR